MEIKLSEHFTFDELTNTSHGDYVKGNKEQANGFIKQLKYTAGALEEIRSLIGVPLTITSGYRSPLLNRVVGGSPTSKHTHGLCADFKPIGLTVKEAFKIITAQKDRLHSVRKVIIEGVKGKEWIHLQAKVNANEPISLYSTSDGKTYQEVS
jgi:putative chitinase